MIKQIAIWLTFVIAVYVIQSSFFPLIQFHGTGPDLFILLAGSIAFFHGKKVGAFAGFMLGLFQDLATGTFFGINTLTKMFMGYGCGIFYNRVLRDSFFLPLTAAIVNTIAGFVVIEVIMFLLGYGMNFFHHVLYKLLPMLCYNTVFSWPLYCMVRKVNDKATKKK